MNITNKKELENRVQVVEHLDNGKVKLYEVESYNDTDYADGESFPTIITVTLTGEYEEVGHANAK